MNRGVARRTVIEGRRDADEFLAGVLRAHEEGFLEVHAYALMATHFHMLVRSPVGELSRAMMLIQNLYARWFNRGRRRDGPLWRARFLSKIVRSEAYWRLLVRYIDQNPVRAGIVELPWQYPLGSAWHYFLEREGPPWLSRGEVEAAVRVSLSKTAYTPADYAAAFGDPLSASARWMVERHGFSKVDAESAFADLFAATPEHVRSWMERKARTADGTAPGAGVLDPGALLEHLAAERSADPEWWVQPRARRKSGWRALSCALLHQLSGCTQDETARLLGIAPSTVGRHVAEHAILLSRDWRYGQRAGEIVAALLRGRDAKRH